MSDTKQDTLRKLREVEATAKAFREQHPDSPLYGVAWKLSALIGKIEAAVNSAPEKP